MSYQRGSRNPRSPDVFCLRNSAKDSRANYRKPMRRVLALVEVDGQERELISKTNEKKSDTLPEEFDSEFADYDRGAFAYRRGKEHWDEAGKAWRQLLQRPEAAPAEIFSDGAPSGRVLKASLGPEKVR